MERFELAERCVREAGLMLRRSQIEEGDIAYKSSYHDLVTYWDKHTEQFLRQKILETFPGDAIVGEEYPEAGGSDGVVWYIDPIDGTTNFVNQHRNYAISVGCWAQSEPLFGLVLDVERDALYWAKKSEGAWRDQTRLHVSSRGELRSMLLTTAGVRQAFMADNPWREQLMKLAKSVRAVRCLGSVALELCELAAGEADIFVTVRAEPWDYNAARIILEEAGGAIYNLDAQTLPHDRKSTVLAVNSPETLQMFRELI